MRNYTVKLTKNYWFKKYHNTVFVCGLTYAAMLKEPRILRDIVIGKDEEEIIAEIKDLAPYYIDPDSFARGWDGYKWDTIDTSYEIGAELAQLYHDEICVLVKPKQEDTEKKEDKEKEV